MNVKSIRCGDRVWCFAPSDYATVVRVPTINVGVIPSCISFTDAAAAISPCFKALYTLKYLCRLREGETVLVQSAADMFGLVAVQISRHLSLRVLASVSTEEERDYLLHEVDIPEEQIYTTLDSTLLRKRIIESTRDQGVDLIINSTDSGGLHQLTECLAPAGRFVELKSADPHNSNSLVPSELPQGATFTSLDLQSVLDHYPTLTSK